MMRFVPLFFALGLLLASGPAFARPEGVAILELRFKEVPPALTKALRTRLQKTLEDEGYRVVTENSVTKRMREIGTAPGCSIGPCLSQVGRVLLIDRALSGGVAAQGSSYDLVLTMVETGAGTVMAQVNDRCEVCTFKEVEDAMGRAAQELHKKSLVYLSTRASLKVTSTPSGATVLINSLPVGKTPLTLLLSPGKNLLEVAAKKSRSYKKELVLEAGKSYTVDASLLQKWAGLTPPPKQPTSTPVRSSGLPSWLKWTALGGGVVLSGVGGGLWALDGQETGDPRYVHDTKTAGVTLVSVGAAAVLGAAVLYLFEPPSEGQASGPARATTAEQGAANVP